MTQARPVVHFAAPGRSYLQCGNCHALVETADLGRFPLDEYRCYSCLKPFHNKTLTCIWCGYCGEADMFRWAQLDGNCPSCGRSVMRKRGIDQDVCPECGKAFFTTLAASIGRRLPVNRWGLSGRHHQCPHCRAQIGRKDGKQKAAGPEKPTCTLCRTNLRVPPEQIHSKCGHCGAYGWRFTCTDCGMPFWAWAKQDFDTCTTNCPFCDARQLNTICLMCKHPVAAAPEAQVSTCGNCGALRRRFTCTACGKPTDVWARKDPDVWVFHCTACGAEQLNSFCFMCEHPVAATPEAQLLTCENCGALRRRFSCASCGKATAVWAPEDRDVWTFNCSACGAAQRTTIPQGVEGVDVRRPASASGGRS